MNSEYKSAREVVMDETRAGQRLDNFLFAMFRELPRSRVYSMLRKGEVRINGGRVKQHYRLKAGDRVRLPPVHVTQKAADEADTVPQRLLEALRDSVIYQDERLLVLNKPEGVAVHSGSGVRFGVIEGLRALYPDEPMLELVHRLDRGTSGVLLLARNRAALTLLHELIRDGAMEKRYLALLAGRWQGGERRLEHQLQREHGGGKQRHTRVVDGDDGKAAVAIFRPQALYADASLMEVELITGRTHQIRVQSAELGMPLLGDEKYGDFALNRDWKKRGLKRMFLHACKVSFRWPDSGERVGIEAPLPQPLQTVLAGLA